MFQRDIYYMRHAYNLAMEAEDRGEVPVAAIVVHDDKIIGQGFNRPIMNCDPTAHAEIVAMREAGKVLNNYRLNEADLYVTLEPCMMCAGAMIHARIKKLVFGAYDPKSGAVTSAFELFNSPSLNHQVQWKGGVLEAQCSHLLKAFFKKRRCL